MNDTPPITIWVHGTKPLKILPRPLSNLQIETLNLFTDTLPGLHKASELDPAFHHHNIMHL